MRVQLLTLLVIAGVAGQASAWWCNGHMLVVTIAMEFVSQDTFSSVSKLIDIMKPYYPLSPDVVTSACWADDLKVENVTQSAGWHFINIPVVKGPISEYVPAPPDEYTVTWAIDEARSTIASNKSSILDKARQLRFLLHFVGDIHQPLHVLTLYSMQFPHGDAGGNAFNVSGVNQTELHAFFDSGAGMWADSQPRPLPANSSSWLDGIAQQLTQQFPKTDFTQELAVEDPMAWAYDLYNRTSKFVYSIEPNQVIPASYIAEARTLCMKQVALAGYRLAQDLDKFVKAGLF